ncbi:plasma membrane g protein coupled receptor that interacts with the heterotrimeric g protein a [Botrytis cinerea]
MAPLPTHIARTVLQFSSRDIGDNTNEGQDVSISEGLILQKLALSFATASVASSILAFYCLIMLLIQSDMFKALWFMVFPIVIFLHGPVEDASNFCQISGFFLSLGIEASDISVLMVAVHTALYIFRPKSSAGEGGLYPYRKIAYAIWIVFPILTSSLAFVNNHEAYVAQGTFCYLPVRPFWYRLALSWIPRYIIFITIVTVYVSIYFYVRFRFRGFENSHSQDSYDSNRRNHVRRSLPPPALTLNGPVTEIRRPSAAYVSERRKQSSSTLESLANMRNNAHQFMWTSVFHSRNRTHSVSPPSEVSAPDTDSYAGASTPQNVSEITNPVLLMPQQILNPLPNPQFRNSWRESIARRLSLDSNGSIYIHPATLQQQNGSAEQGNPYDMNLVNSSGQDLTVSEMIRTREKIRRQLRFLFIYPLVYLGMWTIPFVSHILQFNDKLAVNPPLAINLLTTVFVCAQGAVDCWLFSTREKPWKHIPGTGGTFSGVSNSGEARQAYKRRDQELAQRRFEAQAGNSVITERGRGDRSWWDVEGADRLGTVGIGAGVAAMTPVQEEFSISTDGESEETSGPSDPVHEHDPVDTSVDGSAINGTDKSGDA